MTDHTELIKKHLGPLTPEWIINKCNFMLDEMSKPETTDCGADGVIRSCKHCSSILKKLPKKS